MANSADEGERPVPLLTVSEDGKFSLGQEAIDRLSKVKGKPLAIISIAGLYRTGKSYILNRLMGRQHGFEIGGTTNSCTKGIYMWGNPIPVKSGYGELNLILLDTEGIGSLEKDQTHDAKIFSLSVLLSSFFIYNSMGVIDENALDKISFVANLTKHIHIHSPQKAPEDPKNKANNNKKGKAGKEEDDESDKDKRIREMSLYFPDFLWLLRDFSLKLVDKDGQPITSRQYLEQALTQASLDKTKAETRQVIRTVFPSRDCVTLVRPVVDEEDLQNLDAIPWESLRDKFRTEVTELVPRIFEIVKPKLLFGQKIDGGAFITLVKSYVDAINSGAVPTIRSAWESVSELECQKAVESALKVYIASMDAATNDKLPIEQIELEQIHKSCHLKAFEDFDLKALGELQQLIPHKEKLEAMIFDEHNKYILANDNASQQQCKQLLLKLYEIIDAGLQKNAYPSLPDLTSEWKRLIDTSYLPVAKGKYKFIVLSEFITQRLSDTMTLLGQTLMDNLNKQHKKEMDQMRDQLNDEKDEKRKMREEFTQARQDFKSQLDRSNQHIDTLTTQSKQKDEELAQMRSQVTKLEKDLATANQTIQELRNRHEKRVEDAPQIVPQNNPPQKKRSKCTIM